MGMFSAVGSVYRNMFNFSGRARRAEYWWFALFTFLVSLLIQVGLVFWLLGRPELALQLQDPAGQQAFLKQIGGSAVQYGLIFFAATFFLYWLPTFAVTVRRLHDTGRSGWWLFKPFLVAFAVALGIGMFAATGEGMAAPVVAIASAIMPLAISLWYLIVFCQRGTDGENRFGPDPLGGGGDQGFMSKAEIEAEERALSQRIARNRSAEFEDYYRARVLPAIERNKEMRQRPAQ